MTLVPLLRRTTTKEVEGCTSPLISLTIKKPIQEKKPKKKLFQTKKKLFQTQKNVFKNIYKVLHGTAIIPTLSNLATRYKFLNAITLKWNNIFHIRLYTICSAEI